MFLVFLFHSHLSAIAAVHSLHGCADPTKTFVVNKVMKGIANIQPGSSQKLLPINKPLLHNMLSALPHVVTGYDVVMYKSLFLFSYYCCTRASETTVCNKSKHTLQLQDITLLTPPHTPQIKVQFKSSKHCSSPTSLVLSGQQQLEPCPLLALLEFMLIRGSTDGPLFLRDNGSPVTRHFFSKIIKRCLNFLSLDPKPYNTHSFRIGRTTDLAAYGAPPSVIKLAGRWHSSAFEKYIRIGQVSFPQ